MRAAWKGEIRFGLVTIPVKLFSASEERGGLKFEFLHRADLSPIRYARICEEEGKEVRGEDVVRGYQYKRGSYVVLSDGDFRRAAAARSRVIQIVDFIVAGEVEPAYFEKPYYVEPQRGAEKAYVLLREALKRTGTAGVATFVLRGREHLLLLAPASSALSLPKGALMAHQLRFASELRETDDLRLPQRSLEEREMEAATAFIRALTAPFRPHAYRDTYAEELKRFIREKVRGKEEEAPEPEEREPAMGRVKDLAMLLRESLERTHRKSPKLSRRKEPRPPLPPTMREEEEVPKPE